jgi:hypothetical protein
MITHRPCLQEHASRAKGATCGGLMTPKPEGVAARASTNLLPGILTFSSGNFHIRDQRFACNPGAAAKGDFGLAHLVNIRKRTTL